MPRLSPEQWANIRYAYEAGETVSALARRFPVARSAIQKRAEKEGWTQDVEPVIRRMVAEKVAGVVAGATGEKKAEAMGEEAARRMAVVQRHRAEWGGLEDLRQRAIARALEAEAAEDWDVSKRAKILADMLGDHMSALKIKQDGERKAWGLDDAAIKIDVTKASDAELEALVRGGR